MQLLDLFNKYSASELIATIDAMFPDTEQFHPIFEQAYAIMKGLTPVASKKKIRYKVIYDETNDFEFSEQKTVALPRHGRCASQKN